MTEASDMSNQEYNKLTQSEKSWVNKTTHCPDGINKVLIETTGNLIKQNRYPWGCSRRIYVDKPGKKDIKRPITIPPFMDKVVQEAITMILTAIYEPYFESLNCSLGFRPNKGVHDAIVALTGADAIGLNMAIEGDIKSAYDKVNRNKFIEIIGKKIQDRKLINFLKKIPLCRECHYSVHSKRYGGQKISLLCPKKMFDNRIITIESHINKAALMGEEHNYTKSLEEKGWKYKGYKNQEF